MPDLSTVPGWLGTAAIGGVIAALSYAGKTLVDVLRKRRRAQDSLRVRLLQLSSLLNASKVAFEIQNDLAGRLASLLEPRPGDEAVAGGYEKLFASSYDKFTAEQAELHSIIRGITIYAMRPANLAMSKWLEEDTVFRIETRNDVRLAAQLNHLASHLMLWHAKYQAWIPDNPKHALVYMADEQNHGLGFPEGLDELVSRAVSARLKKF